MLEAEKFFETHRKYRNKPKKLIETDRSDEEITRWVLTQGYVNWLKIDLKFLTNDFLKDEQLASTYYVNHRDHDTGEGTHQGWKSCTLHGISVEKTNHWATYGYDSEPSYQWTELGKKTKHIKNFCESLPFEKLDRVRFMKLSPKGFITPHNDNSEYVNWDKIWELPLPLNIAMYHPPACFMTIEKAGVVPFKDGETYLVNILKNHSVINFSSYHRKHIIIHGVVGNQKDKYCKLLADSYRKQYDKV